MTALRAPASDVRPKTGTFIKTPHPVIAEILGGAGLDFGVVDAEHAPFDRAAVDLMVMAGRSGGLPLLVRVPDTSPAFIMAVLDMGAHGIVVPRVDSLADARSVVASARFSGGKRGLSNSPRYASYGRLSPAEAARHGDGAIVMCQIESRGGLDEVDAIAALPGVDGLFIGRADLAQALGVDSLRHPAVADACARIVEAALRHGKQAAIFLPNREERDAFAAMGVAWFVIGSDQSLLKTSAAALQAA
ncbi:MAG TPA: aldolase/citrate lyase family protein [Xanthobacteraceae bacterium]|nr:aldolase/citrate lyase family protein [Xanthobacteraceae bacterium]